MNRRLLRTKKIGVLMGGISAEREVSLKTGHAVAEALRSLRYNVVKIDVDEHVCSVLRKKRIDLAFIALHGGYGENGAIQGMLEILNIPYTGSGILASALAMDKEASKMVFLQNGIPVAPYRVIRRSGGRVIPGDVTTGFPMPWVVKPATEGSSVGVEIVRTRSRLGKAIRAAFSYGDAVIVERYLPGKEVQIGILNDAVIGGVEVRPSTEFYSYEAKYTSGMTEYVLPPEIPASAYGRAATMALAAHRSLGCSGATRVDLIVDRRGRPFVLEVNTIPGMTETSLLPKIARSAGISFPGLMERILGGVDER